MTEGTPEDGRHPSSTGPELPPRDLDWVAPLVPAIRRLVDGYFRAEVRGLARVPEGPVLFVGNHSGGGGSPDSIVFYLAFLDHFGVDRPLYWLAHDLLMSLPWLGDRLRRLGVVTASSDTAAEVLSAGGTVVVYPGGEAELHRPWRERHDVKLLGRQGFLRLARDTGVPLVPFVGHGGHHTYLPLTDGRALAHALRLDRLLNLNTLPISLAAPFGLHFEILGHLPLPARITMQIHDPIDVAGQFGDDLDAAYAHVEALMQASLDRLAAEAHGQAT